MYSGVSATRIKCVIAGRVYGVYCILQQYTRSPESSYEGVCLLGTETRVAQIHECVSGDEAKWTSHKGERCVTWPGKKDQHRLDEQRLTVPKTSHH